MRRVRLAAPSALVPPKTNRLPSDALPFCELQLKVSRLKYPCRWRYAQVVPKEANTIGDHLKRRRLRLHLFQADVAKLLGVDIGSVRKWEENISQPAQISLFRIIDWLGYDPRP